MIKIKKKIIQKEKLMKKVDPLVNTENQNVLQDVVSYGVVSASSNRIFVISANFTDSETYSSINVKTYQNKGIPVTGFIKVADLVEGGEKIHSSKEVLNNCLKVKIKVRLSLILSHFLSQFARLNK